MRYEDFSIHFEPPQTDGSYPVRVLASPAGEGEGTFHLPFTPEETADLLQALGGTGRGGASRNLSSTEAGALPSLEEAGQRLFEALFTGQVRSLLDRSLGHIENDAKSGLRIKLCLAPEHPDLARLASLPWEILYRRDGQEYLNLSRRTPVVRYLRVPRPLPPVLKPPLRILVALAQPFDAPLLDLEREYRLIEDAAGHLPGIEVIPLFHATAASLRTKLLESTFHVLHFMGHGDFDPATGEGVLLLEDGTGAAAPLPGRVLADLARDFRDLQLLFLNACQTAQADQDGLDPFAGVATALVLAGMPAVLAMRSPVSDESAIVFSQKFYERLAAGDPVDAATSEARLAVRLRDPGTLEWATPALFTRAPEGRLFEPAERPGPGSSPEIREGILDFSRLLADKTEGFVGRQWIFDAVQRFTRKETRGYFVLRGDPGIGKSALLAQLVKREGYLHHFNVRSEGIRRPETFLRNVCSQLIATYHLEQHTFLPPEATRSSLFLSSLLEKVASRLQPGEKVILAVDALDEADSTLLTPGANVLYLPTTLPPGVFVIVTTRRDDEIPLLIGCEQQVLHIDQDSEGNIADVYEYVTSKLQLAGIQTYLAAQNLDEPTFVAELVHKSQGNFMYLRYVLPEIEQGAYRDRSFELLPIGLQCYYEDHWKRMRRRDEDAWFAYQLPVLVALTVVKEPVSIDLVQDFSEVAERKRIVAVLKEWDQFLYTAQGTGDDGRPEKRYRLYHESFQEFIAAKDEVADERVSLAKAHGKIADALWRELYGTSYP